MVCASSCESIAGKTVHKGNLRMDSERGAVWGEGEGSDQLSVVSGQWLGCGGLADGEGVRFRVIILGSPLPFESSFLSMLRCIDR